MKNSHKKVKQFFQTFYNENTIIQKVIYLSVTSKIQQLGQETANNFFKSAQC